MIGSFLFGVFGWLVGALGHDAGHFACSRRAWINDICVWAMSLLCNPVMWQHQHTFAHHSFTNEFDHDPDLHHFHLLVRVHRHVKQDKQYQNQKHSAFVFMAYTLVTFGTCFWIPLDMMQTGFLHGIVEWSDRGRLLRALGMFAHMIGFVLLVLVTPFMSLPWYKAIAAVVIHLATSGMLFGIFSQVNHLNEASLEADSNTRSHSNRPDELKKSWAAAQVETSNNFAPNSFLWHILSNGLNLQIEHHLFPSINHSHLPRIAPIVEQTCKEYGVQYKCYKSWREVMAATLEWLDRLATDK
jgi:fatty acid desaturase